MQAIRFGAFAALLTLALSFIATPALAAETLHTGEWTRKTQKASGTWSIVEEDGTRFIDLSADFKTKKAPDLAIYFSPKTVEELTNTNAEEGAVKLAPLESPKGSQRYEIPASIDLGEYTSVMIHCKKYTKLWCAAAL